jgi:outer membrane protein assembly factor BamB
MRSKWRYLLLAFLVLLSGCASEQARSPSPAPYPSSTPSVGPNTWVRTFTGSNYGAFFDIALTPDGNILAVGATNHLHVPPYSGDALLMELTLQGDLLWEQTWGGDGYEQALSVAPAQGGGFYIFGETDSYGAGDRDFFLLKVTATGSEEWFRTYGRVRREWPYGMLPLANGDLLLYGFTEVPLGSDRDRYAVRVRPDGEVVWEYVGEGSGEQLVLDALETAQGDLVLAVSDEEDGELVQLGAGGNVQWIKRYELAGWQYASQLEPVGDGELLLAGFSMDSSSRQVDTWLARCSSSGELEWQTSFGEPSFDDYATSMLCLSDGTYLLGAISNGILLTRVDQNGQILWRRSLLEQQTVYGAMALAELEGGGYLVAGLIQLVNGRSYDAILLRTDAEGHIAG